MAPGCACSATPAAGWSEASTKGRGLAPARFLPRPAAAAGQALGVSQSDPGQYCPRCESRRRPLQDPVTDLGRWAVAALMARVPAETPQHRPVCPGLASTRRRHRNRPHWVMLPMQVPFPLAVQSGGASTTRPAGRAGRLCTRDASSWRERTRMRQGGPTR